MSEEKKAVTKVKSNLHPRNIHRERYDFELLAKKCPELKSLIQVNKFGDESIDFFNPLAVRALNKALLMQYYDVSFWEIPTNYLCPPIPGRADYLHYVADLMADYFPEIIQKKLNVAKPFRVLDIGVGANCIYPIVGNKSYGWHFIGSDIDPVALENASKIVSENKNLNNQIELRLQKDPSKIFEGVLKPTEQIDFCVCNPPFHASAAEAQAGSDRKTSNLKKSKISQAVLNFGGQKNELWCEGGELQFVRNIIYQSKGFQENCLWFTTLISKETHVKHAVKALRNIGAKEIKIIPMGQGNKVSRVLAWTFLTPAALKIRRP